jgi:single-strand DNA-binding protein
MALNRVILYGRLTKDVELRQTNSGISVARFTVACDRQFANKETGKREADFIEVQAWRNTAEFVSRWFHKGDAITVEGSIRNNNYEDKNGVKHYSYVVMADNVGFGGSKSDNQRTGQQQVPQFGSVPAPQDNGLNLGDLGDFEEIISDGDTPF